MNRFTTCKWLYVVSVNNSLSIGYHVHRLYPRFKVHFWGEEPIIVKTNYLSDLDCVIISPFNLYINTRSLITYTYVCMYVHETSQENINIAGKYKWSVTLHIAYHDTWLQCHTSLCVYCVNVPVAYHLHSQQLKPCTALFIAVNILAANTCTWMQYCINTIP